MTSKTIITVGEVSSGKSSFLNALAGGFISCVSLQRETFSPLWYQFSSNGTQENLMKITTKLEEIHKENENNRENMNKLKEENISTLTKFCDNDDILPLEQGFIDFNLMDFPGLNDSDDKNNLFFKAIETQIDHADLIIFVTDASRAFVNQSEVDLLNNIIKLINKKKNDHDLFIDIIVAVNKFDDIEEPDLISIFNRIDKKVNIKKEKIFRVSSHKLLINKLLINNKMLYVPPFMKKEIEKILQNAGVYKDNAIKKNLNNLYLLGNTIKYNDDNKNSGDWDGIMNYIKNFNTIHFNEMRNMLENKFDIWCDDVLKHYTTYKHEYSISNDTKNNQVISSEIIAIENDQVSLIKIYLGKMEINNIPKENIYEKIINMLLKLCDFGNIRLIVAEYLYKIMDKEFRTIFLNTILDKITNYTSLVHFCILLLAYNSTNALSSSFNNIVLKILNYEKTFSEYIPFSKNNQDYLYNHNEQGKILLACAYPEKDKMHKSPLIDLLSTNNNNINIPNDIKYLIKIATTNIDTLRLLLEDKKIKTDILNSFENDLSLKLRILIYSSQGQCNHNLFTFPTYSRDYEFIDGISDTNMEIYNEYQEIDKFSNSL